MDVKKHISHFLQKTLHHSSCCFCLSNAKELWCDDCEQDFIREQVRCPVCARIVEHPSICGVCLNTQPYFSNAEVLFNYEYPGNELIKTFKFRARPELANCFANRLSKQILNNYDELPDALVPVPLHKSRQRQRGFNQSLQLANCLNKELGVTVLSDLCKRVINTSPQSSLPMKTRKKNVKNAFVLNHEDVPRHIVIIDDVITTGSTINEISKLFKKAGCDVIDVWAIART